MSNRQTEKPDPIDYQRSPPLTKDEDSAKVIVLVFFIFMAVVFVGIILWLWGIGRWLLIH